MKYLKKLLFPEKKNLTEELSDYLQEIFDEFKIPEIPFHKLGYDFSWCCRSNGVYIHFVPEDKFQKIYNYLIKLKSTIEKRLKRKIEINIITINLVSKVEYHLVILIN